MNSPSGIFWGGGLMPHPFRLPMIFTCHVLALEVVQGRLSTATLCGAFSTLLNVSTLALFKFSLSFDNATVNLDPCADAAQLDGAFVLTNNMSLIAVGLGIGSFYAILLLALFMYPQRIVHILELLTRLNGVAMIGTAWLASHRWNCRHGVLPTR